MTLKEMQSDSETMIKSVRCEDDMQHIIASIEVRVRWYFAFQYYLSSSVGQYEVD